MSLDLFATGSTSAYNFDVPTNPKMTTQSTFSAGTDVLYSAIYTDDSEETVINEIVSSATLQAEYENLSVTKGFNIHCFDTVSSVGKDLSSIASTIDDYYYFVLIHSDNHLKHHFARITEIKTSDVLGDSFDFEPKLGNEIAQGTKFKLFKGPATSSKGVAFSAGIKLELQNELQVARPHFWFVNDSLDKKNQLDHNTKYFARMEKFGDGSSVTMDGAEKVTFVTVTDYAQKVVDYSKYSLNASITDVLRTKDAIATYVSNEGITLATQNDADYDLFAPNAVRDTDDTITSTGIYVTRGPKRYLHYDYSPTKNNSNINVIDLEVQESIGDKASYVDLQISDPYRILSKKINNYDALRIRQMIHRGDFNDWVSFGATISSLTSNVSNQSLYAIKTPVDLRDYINAGDEVLINSRVMIALDIFASSIRFRKYSRLETEASFSHSTSLTSIAEDTIIYRRAWNTTDGTLLTGMRMIDGRQDSLSVSLISNEFSQLEATVTSYVSQTGLLTISLFNQGYDTKTALDKMSGQYMIYNEKLNGRITNLKQEKVDGATIMNINGADKLKELLDPIIEKNTLFSKDIVYSTDSPYNKVTALSVNATSSMANTALTFSGSGASLVAGDKIFAQTASGVMTYLGLIGARISDTSYTLNGGARSTVSARPAFKATTKYMVFNKALSSNSFVSSATSLYGTANKGLFFESGTTLVSGEETVSLPSSSINTTNPNSRGYYLSEAKNMKSDNLFQARLDDNASSKSYSSFDTVNTLIDFNILSIKNVDGNQIIEIAPHIPLTLGRVDINYGNVQDTTFTSLGTSTAAITATTQRFIITQTTTVLSGVTSGNPARNYHGKPLYINNTFAGIITLAVLQNDNTNIYIYVDRILPVTSSGATLSSLAGDSTYDETGKLTHELSILNGGHLHGGKVIALLHPFRDITTGVDGTTYIMEYPLYYSGGTFATTNSERHGMPYYRIINLEKGNVTKNKIIYTNPTDVNYSYYEEKKTKIPYYASAYKFDPAFYIDSVIQNNITGVGKTDNNGSKAILHLPIESRDGSIPPSGSNFFDTVVHDGNDTYEMVPFYIDPTAHKSDPATEHEKTPFTAKDTLWQPDPKVARMFLFINSDLRPYSSTRKDSLLNTISRDITKYNILALTDGVVKENSELKASDKINTKTVSFNDGSYSSSSILSSEKTLSSLNRFGMMRLTELCFDWAFNQFDPENPPDKDKVLPKLDYFAHSTVSLGRTISSATNKVLTMSSAFNSGGATADMVSDGDLIIDAEGRYIGRVDGLVNSGTGITLHENHYRTNGGALNTTSTIYKVTDTSESNIRGHGVMDSFVEFNANIHMLRSAVVNTVEDGASASTVGYSKSGESWNTRFGTVIGASSGSAERVPNLFAPVNLGSPMGQTAIAGTNHPSLLFKMLDALEMSSETNAPSDSADNETYNKWFLPIFLDRFSIEDGTALADSGMVGAHIKNSSRIYDGTGNSEETYGLLAYALNSKFANTKNIGTETSTTPFSYDKHADGVFLGFKPRLYLTTGNKSATTTSAGLGGIAAYSLTATGQHTWLKHTNLTGTYLVSNDGRYLDSAGAVATTSGTDEDIGLDGVSPNSIVYVISHEIDHDENNETHILILDKVISNGYFRIMQPNHTCTYEYSPKEIELNTLSSKYTKMPYEDSMYNSINNYGLENARGDRTLQGDNEGILSMYVLLDVEGISHENGSSNQKILVPSSNLSNMLLGTDGEYCISDGDTAFKTNLTYNKVGSNSSNVVYLQGLQGHSISLDNIKETLGVVSVSEITSITVGGESPIDTNSKRAMIGSVVSICQEADDLIEELLEEQDTPFTITKETYPLFVAPNFDGISIFEAINFLLRKKDQTLVQKNETFEIKPKDSSGFYNDLLISDNGDIRIYEYEVLDSTFEEYNEIIVNGKSHKSKKQDLRSVKKVGRKTLKVFERKLTTQEEVDTRAKELLILHKGDNKKLRIKIGHNNISQIQVGDVVNVEVKQENIPRNQYIVLEITHLMTGLLQLELGKYSKQLEDRFSELTVDVDTAQTLQNNKSNEQAISLGFLETVKIKPIRLLVRKRATTGSMTLGFTTALNTGTAPLGFTGGATITYTDLVEEEF
jgi:hypothetical protein